MPPKKNQFTEEQVLFAREAYRQCKKKGLTLTKHVVELYRQQYNKVVEYSSLTSSYRNAKKLPKSPQDVKDRVTELIDALPKDTKLRRPKRKSGVTYRTEQLRKRQSRNQNQ